MPAYDLRQFLEQVRQQGQLREIEAPASTALEITHIADCVSKGRSPDGRPWPNQALWFRNPHNSATGEAFDIPLVINAMGSHSRTLLALGAPDYRHIQARIQSFVKPPMPGNLWQKLQMLPKLAELNQFLPKTFKGAVAPCHEVVITDTHQPMLDKLPILTCWPDDGGPFITMPVVFTKDPATGERNCGMYRLQKYDNCTTGMHWHKHHDGARIYENARRAGKDRLEVAVALGAAPHVVYSATAPLPPGLDELIFAGFLRSQPVELVRCKTVDLEVPAHAEIILEGYVLLDELRREGPFGDHTGYYSLADDYPVFHLTAMTHRHQPIYLTTIVGKPPQEDCYLGKATERIFLPLLQLFISEIVDMNLPWEGVFHNCVIVSIDKRFPGHAKKVMSSLWGFGQLMFSKYVIVVDRHVDVQDVSQVAWHVFNNTDPRRDMMFADGPLDILDHATPMWGYGSKVGIDATRKWPSEGFTRDWPDEIEMDTQTCQQVAQRWEALFPGF
jgi:4-hydroxy-3-polyprenylbenzoate decarboxylase